VRQSSGSSAAGVGVAVAVAVASGEAVSAVPVGVAVRDASLDPPSPHALRATQAKTISTPKSRHTPARIARG
jgi:hypothetical protein